MSSRSTATRQCMNCKHTYAPDTAKDDGCPKCGSCDWVNPSEPEP
jgi:predicted  nucleic acid-binding Zn-ribbon protein